MHASVRADHQQGGRLISGSSAKGQVTWYCTELTGCCVRAGTTSKTFYLWRRVAGRGQATSSGWAGSACQRVQAQQDAQQLIGDMVGGTAESNANAT